MKNYYKYLLFIFILIIASCKKEKAIDPDTLYPSDFLSANQFKELVIEVVSVHGSEPESASLNNLKSFLINRLNKPNGIRFVQKSISDPNYSSYSVSQIKDIEDNYRNYNTYGERITAFIFFADANYSGDFAGSKSLGLAYAPSSMVIFKNTIEAYAGGIGQPSVITMETTVLMHEFGHILGLVNNGTPMTNSHEDTSHPRHCNVESCLMYYIVETGDMAANLLGGNIPELDPQCLADLRANGGK